MVNAGYLVFALDSRGQGANKPLKEYHYDDMVEDIHEFVKYLSDIVYTATSSRISCCKPYVFGWSDGGIVALMAEMKYPGFWQKIAVSGVNIFPEGFIGVDDLDAMQEDIDAAPPLLKMCFTEPHIQPEQLHDIGCSVLVVAGENDIVKVEHTRLIANNIPHSQLMILAGEDHDSHIKHSDKIGNILIDWFDNTTVH